MPYLQICSPQIKNKQTLGVIKKIEVLTVSSYVLFLSIKFIPFNFSSAKTK